MASVGIVRVAAISTILLVMALILHACYGQCLTGYGQIHQCRDYATGRHSAAILPHSLQCTVLLADGGDRDNLLWVQVVIRRLERLFLVPQGRWAQ